MILRSVTSRLVFFYCLLLVVLGGAFLAFTVLSFQHYTRETLTSILSIRAREVWNIAGSMLDQPIRLHDTIERRFAPESQDRFIRIHAGNTVLYRSGNPTSGEFAAARVPILAPAREGKAPQAHVLGSLLILSRSFRDADGSEVTVDAGQSDLFARTLQQRLATSLFVGLPLLLLLAALAGVVLMRRALTPVEVMINAAETYTFNDPHKRLPTLHTEPRIEALGLALNRMLDRLDNAYSHASRFSADAAHELRTPLTIIRGELELVVSGERLPADVDNAISNALEEMTRLSSIVDSLITLSRMESLWGKKAHGPVDLWALADETIEQMNLLAEEKKISLKRPSGPSVVVAGDRDRLKQILVNLIDNAIKYTPDGGRVAVETGIDGDMGFVTVEDSGIGIDPSHHDRVFDRFYRVSPDRGDVGAGLGLAIVKSICNAHGGAVTLRSAPEFGSCFRVEIPLLSATAENKMAAAKPAAATDIAGK
ncbi:MAG TPA: HAMP domain-containing sensor histidine kinase [Rhizomicrobium sp.]|jgi:heavy metal sensor kinase|nr:HAMP domain-containing sensor histidine kinase [Rhizomicrobium sp.]